MKKTIVFAGGGTAGHVMPNIALIDALKSEFDCVYVGGVGMERDICRTECIPFRTIDTVKLRRGAILRNISVPIRLHACIRSAQDVLDEIKPDLIFSKGGYAALPVVLAARGTPLIAHESDLTPGIVTKLSARRAVYVLCAFESCARRFGRNGLYVGTPLRQSLYAVKARPGRRPVLLVMGGSSGAATLNAVCADALPELLRTFDVVHLTGKNKHGGDGAPGYRAMEFCNDMPGLYAAADVAVTRAGANSLAELTALGIPAVAVPLEKASRGDQLQNAKYFAERGAVKVLRESELSAPTLIDAVKGVYARRAAYSAAMSAMRIDGTARICDIVREVISRSPSPR